FPKRGYEVMVLDPAPKTQEMEKPSITYVQGNLVDVALVNEVVQGMDVIINLAWSFADDSATIFGEDIKGHINLLEAASSAGVHHLIYTSTATVYGRAVQHPVTETHPGLLQDARKPLYALGKYTAEELCRLYNKQRGLPVTIFRFWWAFGENIGGRHLRDLVKKALRGQPLEMVHGAGGAFLTMEDLSKAIASAMEAPGASGQIYNLGSLFLTWEEIGAMIVNLTHSKSSVQLVPSDRWKGPAFLNEVWDLSWEKAQKDLGFKPGHSNGEIRSQFTKALQKCIDEVKEEELKVTQ
ncbi:MAG: NAD-dependent epimerase/dehydratase family protein, partial [Thermodesulfobacteriota bacterium]